MTGKDDGQLPNKETL